MHNYIKYFAENVDSVPLKFVLILMVIFGVMQAIGEIMEFFGKVAPECLKIRKYIARKRAERDETTKLLKDTKQLLSDVNSHYSPESIAKRNSWMSWVNARADVYDKSIVDINDTMLKITEALEANTKLTEEMFVQSSRDRIIDFAGKVVDEKTPVSREEFNRIFKVHTKYEDFLKEHGMTNGEVDIAYRMINESYEKHMRSRSFIEDMRGYDE